MKCFSGFTFLEMLLVVSILAAVAAIGVTAYHGESGSVEENARRELVRVEMARIATAMRQFHADTGYWPGEGPFSLLDYSACGYTCTCVTDGASSAGGIDPGAFSDDPSLVGSPAGPALRALFESPVSITQLVRQPVICSQHPQADLAGWNAFTGRGWRGPYLTAEGFVDVSSDLKPNGIGDPTMSALVIAVRNVPAIADAFNMHKPVVVSNINVDAVDGLLMDWRTLPDYSADYLAGAHERERPGTAYMVFGLDGCTPLRIVSAGPDGRYGGANYPTGISAADYDPYTFTTAADKCSRHDVAALATLLPEICTNADTADGQDDLVLCL
jgi:prepilin-type N-terminal cleavage/methylation domain-containing protein